jgi:hypothetical protein
MEKIVNRKGLEGVVPKLLGAALLKKDEGQRLYLAASWIRIVLTEDYTQGGKVSLPKPVPVINTRDVIVEALTEINNAWVPMHKVPFLEHAALYLQEALILHK